MKNLCQLIRYIPFHPSIVSTSSIVDLPHFKDLAASDCTPEAAMYGGKPHYCWVFAICVYEILTNFTQIPAFSNMLTVGGGRGIRFNLFIQSFAQIEEKYGKEQSETIKDNCHCWIYLKTANVDTATQITKKLGQYTTSSYSRSSSYSSSATSSANVSNSMNLIARPLLTEDEILRIERPYVLVMYSGYYPAMMKLPDLSKWKFNQVLGLGDKEHNRLVREMRDKARVAREPKEIALWGIWKKYGEQQDEEEQQPQSQPPKPQTIADKRRSHPPVPIEHGGLNDDIADFEYSDMYYEKHYLQRGKSMAELQDENLAINSSFDLFANKNRLRKSSDNGLSEEQRIKERAENL